MMFWGDVQCSTSKHGVYYGIQRVQFFVSSDQTIVCQYFIGLSKCCAANFKRASTCFFFSNGVLHGECAYRPRHLSALLIFFFETIIHANELSEALHKWSFSDNYFYYSVRNLARSTWPWPVYGEMMFFPLLDYGPNSTHWNIQKYRNPSVTNAISMFCNNNVAKVLRKLFAFTRHEMFLVWHVGVMWLLFIGHQLRLNQIILISTDKGAGLLSNHW